MARRVLICAARKHRKCAWICVCQDANASMVYGRPLTTDVYMNTNVNQVLNIFFMPVLLTYSFLAVIWCNEYILLFCAQMFADPNIPHCMVLVRA